MYPVTLAFTKPERTSRWKMLLRPILIIPVAFWGGLYSIPVSFVQFAAFWVILFTAVCPRRMWEYLVRYFRFNTLLNGYFGLLTDQYPPFNGREDTAYPIRVRVEYPGRWSRAALFFRWLILLPHYIFAFFYSVGYLVVVFLAFWAVLFAGRIPGGLFSFMREYFIYTSRLNAYMYFLVDEYPPFNGSQSQAAEGLLS